MRVFITLSPIIATVLAQDPPTITEPPSTDFGNWDISMTYASVNTGAYTRNLTAIYTNTPDNIWMIIDCIEQAGPGVEQVDFCTNPEFSYELDGENIDIKQSIAISGSKGDLLGSGVLDIICASQRSCWGRGLVTAAIS